MPSVKINSVCLITDPRLTIVLLHGWGQSLESLRPLGELLTDMGQVYLLDLPGFGRSELPDSVWGTEDFSRRLLDFFKDEGISSAVLIGHSFGGKVAIRFASVHKELVKGLVLIDSSGLIPIRAFKKQLKFFFIGQLRRVLRFLEKIGIPLYTKWFIPSFASPDYLNAGAIRNTFVKVVNEDLAQFVPQIAAPTLLLWGEEDRETPVEMANRLKSLLPRSKLIVLPGRGHYPFIDSGLHLCAHYIKSFLQELGSK